MLGLVILLGLFVVLYTANGMLGQFLNLRNLQVLVHEHTITAVSHIARLFDHILNDPEGE